MTDASKTVFISYRRKVAWPIARAIYQDLHHHGYDVFIDTERINSGQFESIILNQIAARAHFIVILTETTLERCNEPGDWLRREIEHALLLRRNIVPIMTAGFSFSVSQKYLTGKLNELPRYNALTLPDDFFDAAMDRLRERFLKPPESNDIRPVSIDEKNIVQQSLTELVNQSATVRTTALAALKMIRAGINAAQAFYDGLVADYTVAIRLDPEFPDAYYNRANARYGKGEYDAAIADYDEAIRLDPKFTMAYFERGRTFERLGDVEHALADYETVLSFNPSQSLAWVTRLRRDKLSK